MLIYKNYNYSENYADLLKFPISSVEKIRRSSFLLKKKWEFLEMLSQVIKLLF